MAEIGLVGPLLILLTEISHPARIKRADLLGKQPLGFCEGWEGWRWLVASEDGDFRDLAPVRCHSPNKCEFCARLQALENAEMLVADAERAGPDGARLPQLYCVLTTRTPALDLKPFSKGLELVTRALRRRWGKGVQYAALLEYTTGTSWRSQGHRMPHWNLLLKGVPAEARAEASGIVAERWCSHVDAEPAGQYVGEIDRGVPGLVRYLALHFNKVDQRPPRGFRGKRFNPSLGYWEGGYKASEVREEARGRILERTLLQIAQREHGLSDREAYEWVSAALGARADYAWSVVSVKRNRWGEDQVSVLNGEPLAIDRGQDRKAA